MDRTVYIQGGSNMTGTVYTRLHTNQFRSYLNHLVLYQLVIDTTYTSHDDTNGSVRSPLAT